MNKHLTVAAVLALLALQHVPVEAADLKPDLIGLHIGTKHFSERRFNDRNPGLYAVWPGGFTLGTVTNSENSQSVYAAWTYQSEQWNRMSWGLTAGAITGYASRPINPMLIPSLAFHPTERTAVRFSWLTKVSKQGANAVHLSLEWSLK